MKIQFDFSKITYRVFLIEINGQNYRIDPFSNEISFDHPSDGIAQITIREQKKKITVASWLLWFITFPLQAIFHVLTINTDSDWSKHINPYLLNAKLFLKVDEALIAQISFEEKSYCGLIHTVVLCEQAKETSSFHTKNATEFSLSFISYVRKVLSVTLLAEALFVFLFLEMYKISNSGGQLICLILIVGVIIGVVLLLMNQHKLLINSKKRFSDMHKE